MIARLVRERRGGMAVLLAFAMPLLIGMAAFAVDLGMVQLDARRLQGVADAAALAAAARPDQPAATAQEVVAAGWGEAATVRATPGDYDPALAADARFVPAAGGDAARVEVEVRSPTHFAAIFGVASMRVVRSATARRTPYAAFSLGSRLASVDAAPLNALLAGLGIRAPALTLLDYRSLSDARLDVFALLASLRLAGQVEAGSYGAALRAEVPVGQILTAMAATLDGQGNGVPSAALRRLAAAAPARSVPLAALVDAGPLADRATGGEGVAILPALTLLTGVLETGGPRQVALDLGATLPGIASTRVWLAIGERAQHSPLVAVTDSGTPVLRTAQARLYVRATLAPALLPGVPAPVSLEVPLALELAGAEARLRRIDCPPAARAVTIEAKVDPATATLGAVDEGRLGDFSTPLAPAAATLLRTPLLAVNGSATMALGAAEGWQPLRFAGSQIDRGTVRTVRWTRPAAGIAASLIGQARITVQLLGLILPVDPLARAVGALLSGVAAPLDALILSLTHALGVGIGEADVAVTAARCNAVVLVQ